MHFSRPKNIQIDYSFFLNLISYAFLHEDPDDPCFQSIYYAFNRKLQAMERHELFTLYKSGATKEIREKARMDYLKAIGLYDAFQWSTKQDVNVMHDPDMLL